jgi:regulator of protease activity HflC (stomatin/prohibitin superfamily)
VDIIRVDIQSITPPESVQKSMEEERAAEIRRRAVITAAEGERQAAMKKAEGTRASMEIISEALKKNPESKEILRYLVAQDYVDASHKLGESPNAKIVFLDPGKTGEIYNQLIAETVAETTANGNGHS